MIEFDVKDIYNFSKLENMEPGETFIYYGNVYIVTDFKTTNYSVFCFDIINGESREFNKNQSVRVEDYKLVAKGDR